MSDDNELGQLILATRKAKGLSQRKAAALMRISDTWLRWIEQGHQSLPNGQVVPVRPAVATCFDIADALELDAHAILRLAGHPEDSPRPIPTAPPRPVEDVTDSVVDAILADRRLVPEARAHLANQYQLLLRIQASTPPSISADEVEFLAQGQADLAAQADADRAKDRRNRRS